MSSYRKRTQSKPTTAAGLRAQASANGRSIFGNRPRSIAGFFSTHNQNTYSNLLGITPNTYTPPSFINKFTNKSKSWQLKDPFTNNNYPSPYTSYGGTTSGYGGIVLSPSSHSTISSLNLAVPSTSSYVYTPANSSKQSSSALRRASSLSKSKAKFNSSNFSRSSSLQSLTSSEGYIVRDRFASLIVFKFNLNNL